MKALRAISSIALVLLILVSSTSFMVGMHFCMGEVQNVALFGKADVCEQEQNLPPCHRHMKAPCCDDETVIHNADDFKLSLTQLQLSAPEFISVEQCCVFISEIIPASQVQPAYFNYDPPLRTCDITVEHRVFLI
jgi:hypothetical protein